MASRVEMVVTGYQVLLEEMGRMESKESPEWRVQLVSVVYLGHVDL